MQFQPRFDIFALFMVLGLSQGIFLIYFFLLKKNRRDMSNLFFAMLLITLVILSSEIILNYTGLIVKVIRIENYSEPFIFLLMPFLYLIIKVRLNEEYTVKDHVHFFPFVFYFLYCILYFLQPPEFKYNSYVYCYQPDFGYLEVNRVIPDDPLGLRNNLPSLYISQAVVYLYLIFVKLKYNDSFAFSLFGKKAKPVRPLFYYWLHALIMTVLILYVKIHYERDLGDYIIGTYFSVLLYISGFVVLTRQFSPHPFIQEEEARPKYEKSALSEEKKTDILQKITSLLEEKKFFTRNTISLPDTAKAINEPPHYVSQVINEKLGKNFYDLLSFYRIGEAKMLLSNEHLNVTIEDIAEQVGYNSKAAFNKAFKNLTGKTPSEFRKEQSVINLNNKNLKADRAV